MENQQEKPSSRSVPDAYDDALFQVLGEDGAVRGATTVSDDDALRIYREMVRVRAVDERVAALQKDGLVAFHVRSLGEEAAIVGAALAMRDRDWLFPSRRDWGAAIARGFSIDAYLHHVFGDALDPAKGRPMPDHVTARAAKVAQASSLVGTSIVHAVGFAWAAKMRKDDLVVLAPFGEGATSSGDFHNGANFAGVFRAPVVFVCRNNGHAAGTPIARQTRSESFAAKAVAYGIRGLRCDGADALAVFAVTRDAVLRAARGEGATLVELVIAVAGPEKDADSNDDTAPPSRVATRGPVDPLVRLRRYLETRGRWSAAKTAALDKELADAIERAVTTARTAPPPTRASMFDDVYGATPWNLAEQRGIDSDERGERGPG